MEQRTTACETFGIQLVVVRKGLFYAPPASVANPMRLRVGQVNPRPQSRRKEGSIAEKDLRKRAGSKAQTNKQVVPTSLGLESHRRKRVSYGLDPLVWIKPLSEFLTTDVES